MATRSRIGMEMPNGDVRSIYCHYDGYPSGVGALLKEHYTNPEKLESLIALGDISILGQFVSVNIPGVVHTFENPNDGVTVAYHRDRQEFYNPARVDMNIESFAKSDFEEYGYVFTQEGEWKTFA